MLIADEEIKKKEKILDMLKRFEKDETEEDFEDLEKELTKSPYLTNDLKNVLNYLIELKKRKEYTFSKAEEVTHFLLQKYEEKTLTKDELIHLVFHVPCYAGHILNLLKKDFDDEDFSLLYQESLNYEEDYFLPIYDLDNENFWIDRETDVAYLKKNYGLTLVKSDKNVS